MKKKKMILGIAFIVVFTFSTTACFGQSNSGGGRIFNNAEDLKKYLDSQPANSPDKPIKVSMNANEPMLPKIAEAINSAGKYVSLNLTGNALTNIQDWAFWDGDKQKGCETLVSISIPNGVKSIGDGAFHRCIGLISVTIPNSVTNIGGSAFWGCTSLSSVTIPDSVTKIDWNAFLDCTSLIKVKFEGKIEDIDDWAFNHGDLLDKYHAGGIGTYTTTMPVNKNSKWTKQ